MALVEGTFGDLVTHSRVWCRALTTLHDNFVKLYEIHRRDVFRYVLTLRIQPSVAQDITQEAFLRLYLELQKGGSVQNHRAWLYTVAYRMAVDQHRQSEVKEDLSTIQEIVSCPYPDPEQQTLEAERSTRLHKALMDLSPQQMNCLNLRAEGFQYREIGEIVGISTSTVAEFLRRAIVKLRRALYD